MEIQEENLQSGFPELKLLKQVSRVLQKVATSKFNFEEVFCFLFSVFFLAFLFTGWDNSVYFS